MRGPILASTRGLWVWCARGFDANSRHAYTELVHLPMVEVHVHDSYAVLLNSVWVDSTVTGARGPALNG